MIIVRVIAHRTCSIYPSPQSEQDSNIHIPISNNTGSLPDLTVLHFPSPLVTPLDVDGDQSYVPGSSPVSLSPTNAHHMGMAPQHSGGPQSPVQRRRHVQAVPSPLVLNNSNQMQIPLSPPVSRPQPLSHLPVVQGFTVFNLPVTVLYGF